MNTSKNIIKFFDKTIKQYYSNDPGIVGWSNKESQYLRFDVLSQIAPLENQQVIDIGCGVGDMYNFFKSKNMKVKYLGIDIHPGMVAIARKKYQDARFLQTELENIKDSYDFVLCSGAFNLQQKNNRKYIEKMIGKMYDIARTGVAFNLLSSYAPSGMRYGDLCYYDPKAIFDYCKKQYERVILRHDYLPHDFTVYINKVPMPEIA